MAGSANSVEIIISASDRASGVIAGVGSALTATGKAASAALTPVTALTNALTGLTGGAITNLARVLSQPFVLASSAVSATTPLVLSLGRAFSSLLQPVAQVGGAILTPFQLFGGVIGAATGGVFGLVNAVTSLNQSFVELAQNPAIGAAIEVSLSNAEAAISDLDANLTDTLTGIGQLSGQLFAGAIPGLERFQQRAGVAASEIAAAFGRTGAQISTSLGGAINRVDAIINTVINRAEQIPQRIAAGFDNISGVFSAIAGFDEPLTVFNALRAGVGGVTEGIFALTQEIAFFSAGLQALQQFVVTGPFELLIGQSIRLREELLSTQTALAATNKVLIQGQEIRNPVTAIQSLQAPIERAVDQIRQESLQLVGVTSSELVPLFQQIAGLSSQIGGNLGDAKDLTISFAAALGTFGIPLFQANQEIGSILQGTIDTNSVLAARLQISSKDVELQKQQGTLVEFLLKKLEAAKAGNALAANQFSGLTSNIEETIQKITRIAGEPLLDKLITQLSGFFEYLNNNTDSLTQGLSEVVTLFVGDVDRNIRGALDSLVQAVTTVFGAIQTTLGQIPIYLFKSIANAINSINSAVQILVPAIEPLLRIFGELAKNAYALGGPFLNLFIQFKVFSAGIGLFSGAFGVLAQTLPGLGELLFFLTGRNSSLIKSFIGLRGELGLGAAGFLLLGKNLTSIPPLFNLLAQQIPIFGTAIASLTPSIANLAIQGVGLLKVYPQVGTIFANLTGFLPQIATAAAPLADKILPGLGAQLGIAAAQAKSFGATLGAATIAERITAIENLTNATGRFSSLMRLLGGFLAKSAINFTLLAGGIYVAIQAFDILILKNRGLLQGLQSIADTLITFGKNVLEFLQNPTVIATGIVIGLGVAIKSGLIPAVLELGKTFAATFGAGLIERFGGVYKALQSFSTFLSGGFLQNLRGGRIQSVLDGLFKVDLSPQIASLKKQATAIEAELKGSSGRFTEAIASRRRQIADLNKIQASAPEERKPEIAAQRQQVLEETRAFIAQREAQKQQIARINNEIAALEARQGRAVGFQNFANNFRSQVTGTVAQFAGIASRVSGDTLLTLGKNLGKVGFDRFGDQVYRAGAALFSFGTTTLQSDAAVKGALKNINLSSLTFSNLSTVVGNAAKGLVGLIGGIGKATTGFLSSIGPALAFTAALTAVIEIGGEFIKIMNTSKNVVNSFNQSIAETEKKLANLQAQEAANNAGQRATSTAKSIQELLDDRIKQIQDEQGFFTKLFDATKGGQQADPEQLAKILEQANPGENFTKVLQDAKLPLTLPLTTAQQQVIAEKQGLDQILKQVEGDQIPRFRKAIEENTQLERDLIQLRNQQAAAREQNNTGEVDRIQAEIDRKQALISTNEELLQSVITDLEGRTGLTPEQQKNLATTITTLKQLQKDLVGVGENYQLIGDRIAALRADIKNFGDAYKRVQGEVDSKQKQSNLGVAERLKQGLISQSQAEEERLKITRDGLQTQLNETERGLNAILATYNKLSPEERARDKDSQDDITRLRGQAAELRTQILENEQEEQNRIIDRSTQKALDAIKSSETARANSIQQLRNQGLISQAEADRRRLTSDQQRISEEIAAEQEKLSKLKALGKAREADVTASNQRIQELNQQLLENENRQIEAEIGAIGDRAERLSAAAKDAFVNSANEIQSLRNQGGLTQQQADRLRLEAQRKSIESEIRAERNKLTELEKGGKRYEEAAKESRRKLAELTGQSLQNELDLNNAHIEELKSILGQYTQDFSNQIDRQNQKLQSQLSLYDQIGKAIELQSSLIQAQGDLLDAASGFIGSQFSVLQDLARTEQEKDQLAQAAAAAQLQATVQRLDTETQIRDLQREQNELALKRQQIENEIAIARAQSDLATGQVDVLTGQRQLAQGQITQQEFDARVLAQQARGQALTGLLQNRDLIQQQIDTLPQIEAAQQLQDDLNRTSQLNQALRGFLGTLRPEQVNQVRPAIQDLVSRELLGGGAGYQDVLGFSRGIRDQVLSNLAATGGEFLSLDGFQRLTPNTQRINQQLDQSAQNVKIPDQFQQMPANLDRTLQTLNGIAQRFDLAPPAAVQAISRNTPPGTRQQDIAAAIESIMSQAERQRAQPQTRPSVQAPVTVNINVPAGSDRNMARNIANEVSTQLKNVVDRASQLAGAQ